MKKIIMYLIITMLITSTVNAAEVPREAAPCNASNEAIVIVESFIGDILTEVQNGLGYADARAKSNRIFFNAWLNGQTSGYSYGELVDIAKSLVDEMFDFDEVIETVAGSVITGHCGRNTLGVLFIEK